MDEVIGSFSWCDPPQRPEINTTRPCLSILPSRLTALAFARAVSFLYADCNLSPCLCMKYISIKLLTVSGRMNPDAEQWAIILFKEVTHDLMRTLSRLFSIPFFQTNGQAICWGRVHTSFKNGLGNMWSDRYHLCLRRLGSGCHPAARYGMHVLIGSLVKTILHKDSSSAKDTIPFHLRWCPWKTNTLAIEIVNFRLPNYHQSFIKHPGVLQGAIELKEVKGESGAL
ncbi:hypothetical protein BGX38DRAFT_442677 [Terfezia claveryi]|nr:hypothetical protein BGX38DRAFT_442677 [Terfezia claveryi]